MALRFAAVLLLVAVSFAAAQRFTKHETIRALPQACQQHVGGEFGGDSEWSSSQPFGSSRSRSSSSRLGGDVSTVGPCKLLPPVHEDAGYEYCLKCKAGEKNGVTAEELAQSIRQVVERKLKRNQQFTKSRSSKLNIIVEGVKQPIDLTRVLANTPEVLEKVDDVFFFFPNGQIGRIEFEHGQPDELERITCRAPCRGGPKTAAGQSSWSSSSRNQPDNEDEEEDQEESSNVYGSSSSRYLSNQNKKNKKMFGSSGAYSYGDETPYGSSSAARRQQQHGDEYYPSSSTSAYGRSQASRYGSNAARRGASRANANEEEEDDK